MSVDYINPKSDEWFNDITERPEDFPFSFTYGGVNYSGFDQKSFTFLSKDVIKDNNKVTVNYCWKKDDNLNVVLKCTHYEKYGATEWTVWFESNSGRATHIYFPYFNLEYGACGSMLAIGWAGTWCADFRFNGKDTIYTARSVNGMKTYLKPGEKIRTALFVKADYKIREENYATNYWRRWFIGENLPKADKYGNELKPFSTCCLACDTGLPNSDGSISECHTTWRRSIEKMMAEDIKVDFRWVDAGWYSAPNGESAVPFSSDFDWWHTVGSWELDEKKWPDGSFLESTDFARANGMKTLAWFEPERVTCVDDLVKNYGYKSEWAIQCDGNITISNNIGNPECFDWTVGRIKKMLSENKVEMYREDNNCDPAVLWKHLDTADGENRVGITECKLIDAHYRMWDEIIECTLSYGGCGFVDSCASGGGRNDLESMRRGIPLLRSDYDRTSTGIRLSMTSAFNKWIPFCGSCSKEKSGQLEATGISDKYVWRASYIPVLNVESQFVQDPDQDFDILRFGIKEWKRVNPYLLKDFYVHTPWHSEEETSSFTAYSFYDDDKKEGVLLAFRQELCNEETLPLTLPFVAEDEICILKDEDSGETVTIAGTQMREKGTSLYFESERTARLIWIKTEDV